MIVQTMLLFMSEPVFADVTKIFSLDLNAQYPMMSKMDKTQNLLWMVLPNLCKIMILRMIHPYNRDHSAGVLVWKTFHQFWKTFPLLNSANFITISPYVLKILKMQYLVKLTNTDFQVRLYWNLLLTNFSQRSLDSQNCMIWLWQGWTSMEVP